mmetsp:Transcript_42704/g.91001  ORF Transcript_42704/g.91001 Transcript_42704/m.91001 type:complete len:546 (-) Transcript_42704:129-1766(-)
MAANSAANLAALLAPARGGASSHWDTRTMVLLMLAIFCATLGLELSQMIFAVMGAFAYAALQAASPRRPSSPAQIKKAAAISEETRVPRSPASKLPQGKGAAAAAQTGTTKVVHPWRALSGKEAAPATQPRGPPVPAKPDFRQPSTQPVQAPTFVAQGFADEVEELMNQISPTKEGDRVVQELTHVVRQTLRQMIPEVEVVGFASADPMRGTAFGVAVPEVDIVVSASPEVLAARLHGRLAPRSTVPLQLDARKLQKSAIRACTDRLVASGGFKFRRSAFRGQEPKVTLLAPSALGVHSEAVPVDFSVNSTTPLYNAALLTECGQIEPRAKALILLVKRWAKDRGVCHAAKGHLSPYTWSLLTIYFLQVSDIEEGPLLPPLEGFARSSGLAGKPGASAAAVQASSKTKWKSQAAEGVPRKTVADLFTEFVRFYKDFDWRSEAVCVRLGKRGPPDLALPLHIVLHEDGKTTEVGPSIEDPFEPKRNLGECTTALSLERLRDELTRAAELTSRFCAGEHGSPKPCTLSELLEPWVPPERGAQGEMDD